MTELQLVCEELQTLVARVRTMEADVKRERQRLEAVVIRAQAVAAAHGISIVEYAGATTGVDRP